MDVVEISKMSARQLQNRVVVADIRHFIPMITAGIAPDVMQGEPIKGVDKR
jgi:hypothetical protein